ncbi:MAG: FecR domain-containing protein [Desulfobacterales bacterium]|nr:FecR domain-containing protein [Desulfobacterales bacterium]MBF0395919.1 FecR domain-containing protein [Desulfobacterales bacterium]
MNILILFLILLFSCHVDAANPLSVEMGGEKAQVIVLEGKASAVKKGTNDTRKLSRGEFVFAGDRITTDKNSRIALKLPDGSFMRFDEQTTFELNSASFDNDERNVNVKMIFGKTWAKVAKFFGKKNRFAVSTPTATAGVRGTVYRVNVQKNKMVTVKVYTGEVAVEGKKGEGGGSDDSAKSPYYTSAPKPIAGPHPVSMEEWTYIVKSMQQIDVNPDGSVRKPFSFSPKDDLDDWVRWNKKLDEQQNL